MNATSYRQPAWCRYAAGFAQGKPVIVVENPYGGVDPRAPAEAAGRARRRPVPDDAVRGVALGINMSVPYGAWMGSVIEDSFWAPHDVTSRSRTSSPRTSACTARDVLRGRGRFSIQSVRLGEHKGSAASRSGEACDGLVEQHQPFDVVVLPEGELREDWITARISRSTGPSSCPSARSSRRRRSRRSAGTSSTAGT